MQSADQSSELDPPGAYTTDDHKEVQAYTMVTTERMQVSPWHKAQVTTQSYTKWSFQSGMLLHHSQAVVGNGQRKWKASHSEEFEKTQNEQQFNLRGDNIGLDSSTTCNDSVMCMHHRNPLPSIQTALRPQHTTTVHIHSIPKEKHPSPLVDLARLSTSMGQPQLVSGHSEKGQRLEVETLVQAQQTTTRGHGQIMAHGL